MTKSELPLISNNVTLLVVNSLAINKPTNDQLREKSEFPSWVSHGDLIMVIGEGQNGPKPDLVVAKDGSGNFKTIVEALKASTKRGTRKRFVIYVK